MLTPKSWAVQLPSNLLIISSLILFICFSACNDDGAVQPGVETAFDQAKWQTKDGEDYPYRDGMLKSVVYNDSIRALNRAEILDLLGEPSYYRDNENFLHYTITQKRLGSWPLHTKTMVIKFSEDGTIDWIKIHE